MSWVYWGIVVGLMAMVATLLFCVGCFSSIVKESSPEPGSKVDEPRAAVNKDSGNYREAA